MVYLENPLVAIFVSLVGKASHWQVRMDKSQCCGSFRWWAVGDGECDELTLRARCTFQGPCLHVSFRAMSVSDIVEYRGTDEQAGNNV